jgi:hypothetical protein
MPGIKLPQINSLSSQKEVSAGEKIAIKKRSESLKKVLDEYPVIVDDARIFYLDETCASSVDEVLLEKKKKYDWIVNSKKKLNSVKQVHGAFFNGDLDMVDNLRSLKQDLSFPVNITFGETTPGNIVMTLNILRPKGNAVFKLVSCENLIYYLYILSYHFAEVYLTPMHVVCINKSRVFDNKFMYVAMVQQSISAYIKSSGVPEDFKKLVMEKILN